MRLAWFRPDAAPDGDDLDGRDRRAARDPRRARRGRGRRPRFRVAVGAGDLRPVRLRARRHAGASVHLAVSAALPGRARPAHVAAARRPRHRARPPAPRRRSRRRRWRLPTERRAATPPWPLVRGAWSTWRIPVLASRLTAVGDDALATAIRESCPGARVVVTPAGVPDPVAPAAVAPQAARGAMRVLVAAGVPATDGRRRGRTRASKPARRSRSCTRRAGDADASALADVIVATRWPTFGRPLTAALLGLRGRQAGHRRRNREHGALAGARPADLAAAIDRRRSRRRRPADRDLDRSARRGALADAGARAAGGRRGAARGAGRRGAGVVGSATPPWRTPSPRGARCSPRRRRCRRRRVRPRGPRTSMPTATPRCARSWISSEWTASLPRPT